MAEGKLAALRVDEFLERLASGDPTPGGGAASALAGALGAALVSMVCNLTVGRERYAAFDAEARAIQQEAHAAMTRLQQGIDEDAVAYGAVIAAYGLPRATDAEKAARSATIQDATLEAARVPLGLVEAAANVIDLADRALGQTNPNAASDLAVAALLGVAAVDGAAANVEVNLGALKDTTQRDTLAVRLDAARSGRRELAAQIVARVHG